MDALANLRRLRILKFLFTLLRVATNRLIQRRGWQDPGLAGTRACGHQGLRAPGLAEPGLAGTRVCRNQGLPEPGFAGTRVCRNQGLPEPGYAGTTRSRFVLVSNAIGTSGHWLCALLAIAFPAAELRNTDSLPFIAGIGSYEHEAQASGSIAPFSRPVSQTPNVRRQSRHFP